VRLVGFLKRNPPICYYHVYDTETFKDGVTSSGERVTFLLKSAC